MFFRGRSSRSLDPKGRLMLPPDFRESLLARTPGAIADVPAGAENSRFPVTSASGQEKNVTFVITTYDGCLVVYPWTDWADMESKFVRLPNPSPRMRNFRRLVLGGAEIHSLDAQGRIRLSQDHREYARLDREATLIGLIDRFEIWNPALLKESLDAQNLDDVSEELAASGIDFGL